ncbi:MAG: hypothetical protein ACKVON_14790 [Beijerinckiaceae bacterium]
MILTRLALSPLIWLAGFAILVVVLLSVQLWLPLGANYWDLFTYVDTAYRLHIGQLPHVDFFVPVGPVGYYLYYAVTMLFPNAHTLLAVQYSILIVALPVMAIIAAQASGHSRAEALALVIPFIVFGALPINGIELYPSPGFDGFGNYNRHSALMLYVLAATLLFVSNKTLASVLTVIILVILLLTKVTGFVVGLGLLIHGLVAGRISLRATCATLVIAMLILGGLDWNTGLVRNYTADVIQLVRMNTSFLLPRILTVLSLKFNVILPAVLLIAFVAWREQESLIRSLREIAGGRGLTAFRCLADHDAIWFTSLLLAGLAFETQNTGSHEFILIWPVLLRMLRRYPPPWSIEAAPVLVLIAATALPTPISIAHRAARTIFSMPKYEKLDASLMGPIGRVTAKPEIMRQSRAMLAHYADSLASYERIAKRGVLPSYILFSELDFQAGWLVSAQKAAEAVLAYEAANQVRFERIVTLDFVDPLPAMLGRTPLKDLSIGNDPDRTLIELDARAIAEVNSADAILIPLCPLTTARTAILAAYEKHLHNRRSVSLSPCFKMLLR